MQPSLTKPPIPSSLCPPKSPLNAPGSGCDFRPPHATDPSLKTPHVPTVQQLLEGVDVPTWDQLDVVSRQIKELYALRALLDPQGHQHRTHAVVLPNIPSEDHRIWGGPVPLVSEDPQVQNTMNGWNSLDAFSQDYPSASPYEIQSPEVSRACSRFTTEHGCPTPTSVFDEIAGFKFNIDEWDVESESESEGEDVQMMLDSDEVPLRDVIEAWDQLDDKMIMFRMRSDLPEVVQE
ncbi:hypothetical protein RSOLAG1IB_03185 [Rhizoctonia solani AG-1 IB]|uniref:Uncharacterized protein n=1 Tax=Thanatephorus cucumeris (strain AG1-IB / isolate 7/3/14) TaxID=1108050 RepID=A0A0B7FSS8_THACB|nr:hypothetical protein RSOLAG1IB_03185 [Rhizoctonia solani AG-1 IB]